jgi:hypothetical protein
VPFRSISAVNGGVVGRGVGVTVAVGVGVGEGVAVAVKVACRGGVPPVPGKLHARTANKTVRNAAKNRGRFTGDMRVGAEIYGFAVAVTVGWGMGVDPVGTGVASINTTCRRPIASRNRCK